MSPEWHVTLSCTLSFGGPIVWGLRELWLLRKDRWRPEDDEVTPGPRLPITSAPPPSDGDPAVEPERALPPSLIPLARPARVRQFEDA